jgi:DNA-binding CsgD family transcriptional regulator
MSTGPRYGARVMERARRPATPEEAKALAHPLRQRIVRLCGIRERTNKELADRLERDPATVLHHVRQLVATGFLEPCEERVGPSGAREKPYRSTGMSWRLELDRHPDATTVMVDATRDELAAAGPDAVQTSARLVVRLPEDELAALVQRIRDVVEDAHDRSAPLDDERLPAYGLLALVHRFADGSPAVGDASAPDRVADRAPDAPDDTPDDAGGAPEAHGA